MPARPLDPAASPLGTLLPDFTVRTRAGRTIHRRDFKGRRHLVICFAPLNGVDLTAFVAPVVRAAPSWRGERAEILLLVPPDASLADDHGQVLVAEDQGEQLRPRFGVGRGAALFIADRYGEIAYCATDAATVPVEEVLPLLELLEMRCSL